MVFKPDQQKMQQLLSEAITVLCKNGLNYQSHVNVEALIGITLDDDEVFLVSVKETIQSLKTQQVPLASPTYTTSPAHRQKATPNRKRTTPNAFQASHLSQPVNIVPSDHVVDDERVVDGGEPPAKRLAEVSDVIHIKGEQDEDGEEISETYLDQASANYEEAQDDGGGEQDRNYDTSQLEQFVDFATTSQSSEQDQVDSKAAVFPNQPVPDPTFAISPAIPISSSHQQLNSPATRTPQQNHPTKMYPNLQMEFLPMDHMLINSDKTSELKAESTQNPIVNITATERDGQQVWQCSECNYSADLKATAVLHFTATHLKLEEKSEGNTNLNISQFLNEGKLYWKCEDCPFTTSSRRNVVLHYRTIHLGVYNYHCTICGKGFQERNRVSSHMMAQHGMEKTFKCHLCPSAFTLRASLGRHLKSHN